MDFLGISGCDGELGWAIRWGLGQVMGRVGAFGEGRALRGGVGIRIG